MNYLSKLNKNKILNIALALSLFDNFVLPLNSFAEEISKNDVLSSNTIEASSSTNEVSTDSTDVDESKKEQEDVKNFVSKYTVDMSMDKKYIFDNTATSVSFSTITGRSFKLFSNDVEVSPEKLGKTEINRSTKMTSFTYFAIPLNLGKNEIKLIEYDESLQPTKEIIKEVYVRGDVYSIEVEKISPVIADSLTPGKLLITLKDKWGNPADDRGFITVRSNKGVIKSEDKDPTAIGIQLKPEDGKAELILVGSNIVETAKIEIEKSLLIKSEQVDFTTPYREPILVGVAKTNTNYKFLSGKLIQGDNKIAGLNYSLGGSIFAQGTVFNDMLLTLSASDRKLNSLDDDENVFMRDVNEQRRYPIYGDSSKIDQVATANSNVFFKLEKDKSSLMWGDFTTGQNTSDNTAPRMGIYNRVMTGGKFDLNIPKLTNIELFAANSQQTFERDEIRAAGVSGPYFVQKFPLVNGSERISIETRGTKINGNSGQIIKTRNLNRLTEYNIDYSNGYITFSEPIASFDENLNPNYIVINYEYYSSSIVNNSVYGAKLSQPIPFVDANVGASYVVENTQQPYQLYGASISKKIDKSFDFVAEYANSNFESKSGNAYRAGLTINPFPELNISGEYQLVDKTFINKSGASFVPNSERYSARGNFKPFTNTDISLDYNQDTNFELKQTNRVFNTKLSQSLFSNIFSLGFEGRFIPDIKTPTNDTFIGLVNLGYRTPTFYNMSLNLNRAQNVLQTVDRTRPNTTTIGLDYQITSNIKAFGKAGIMELDNKIIPTTAFGLDTNLVNDLNYLNAMNLGIKYELDGAINNQASQNRIGFNNKLTVLPGLLVGGSFESIFAGEDAPILNVSDNHYSWSSSVEYVPSNIGLRASVKYDGRNGLRETHLFNVNLAGAVGDDFGVFGRYNTSYSKELSRRANTDAVFGAAYRPLNSDYFNALFKYNLKKNNSGLGLLSDVTSNIFSLEGFWQPNYYLEVSSFLKLKSSMDETQGYDPQFSNIPYAALRTQYKLDYNFDLALELRGQYQMENKDLKMSISPEIGYFPVKDFRIGFGYYIGPSMDLELAGTTFVDQGPYINMALKFDSIGALWSSQGIVAKKDLK